MATLAPSFLFGSSLFLEVTKTSVISRMTLNFDQIRPLTAELSALECLKNQYFLLWPFEHLCFAVDLFILAGNEDSYNISDEFEFRPDQTSGCGVICP